jgi:hypothetical protein
LIAPLWASMKRSGMRGLTLDAEVVDEVVLRRGDFVPIKWRYAECLN